MSKSPLGKRRDKYRLRRQLQKGNQRSPLISSLSRSWSPLTIWLKNIWQWFWRLLIEVVRFCLRAVVLFGIKISKPLRTSSRTSHQFNLKLNFRFNIRARLKSLKLRLIRSLRKAPIFDWLLLAIIFSTALLAYAAITRPNASAINCARKINGLWQTNLGEISFLEKPNSHKAIATLSYENIDRGMVKGKIEGELNGDTLDFSWTEIAERGKPKTQGKGILFFRNQCREFYGNYSSISLQNRGFQGLLTKPIMVK